MNSLMTSKATQYPKPKSKPAQYPYPCPSRPDPVVISNRFTLISIAPLSLRNTITIYHQTTVATASLYHTSCTPLLSFPLISSCPQIYSNRPVSLVPQPPPSHHRHPPSNHRSLLYLFFSINPSIRMETEETNLNSEIKVKVVQIFSTFMARVAKFEELSAVEKRFLEIFRQALEFLRRPSIDNTSKLFENVIKANNTDRIQSYIKSGYTHTSSIAENLNKLHVSHTQLLDNASKAKDIINELECLVEDLNLAIESINETSQDFSDLDHVEDTCSEEGIISINFKKPEVIDYATMVAVVYSMVKKDYIMQEKIVSTLDLKTSSGELETYCLMWSLRPFVNDEIMVQAWRLIS